MYLAADATFRHMDRMVVLLFNRVPELLDLHKVGSLRECVCVPRPAVPFLEATSLLQDCCEQKIDSFAHHVHIGVSTQHRKCQVSTRSIRIHNITTCP